MRHNCWWSSWSDTYLHNSSQAFSGSTRREWAKRCQSLWKFKRDQTLKYLTLDEEGCHYCYSCCVFCTQYRKGMILLDAQGNVNVKVNQGFIPQVFHKFKTMGIPQLVPTYMPQNQSPMLANIRFTSVCHWNSDWRKWIWQRRLIGVMKF